MADQVTDAGNNAPKLRAFLAAIAVMPSITRAAKAAGIRRELHYRRYKSDKVYAASFDEAWEMGIGSLEDDAVERAMVGYREPVIYQGQLCYTAVRDSKGEIVLGADGKPKPEVLTVFRPNPALHMFMLRGAKPDKYRERFQAKAQITDPSGMCIKVEFESPVSNES